MSPTIDIAPDLDSLAKLPEMFAQKAPSLVRKLAEVMAAVDRIPKRGRNTHFAYDYATEADIVTAVRKEMAARQLMLFSEVDAYKTQDLAPNRKGESRDPLTILDMTFTFMDGESGETIDKTWVGVGQDGGDKGVYKAMTGAEKYFLLKTFLIPTGDDPEADGSGKSKAQRKAVPDAPATVVDTATGEIVPASSKPTAPKGYAYIHDLTRSNEWYTVHIAKKSGNGTVRYSTKFEPVGVKAEQAWQNGVPVQIEPGKKKGTDDFYMNDCHLWKPEPTDAELDAEIARKELAKQAGDVA